MKRREELITYGVVGFFLWLTGMRYDSMEVKIGRCFDRIESIYQPYIDGIKEIREIKEEYRASFAHG